MPKLLGHVRLFTPVRIPPQRNVQINYTSICTVKATAAAAAVAV